MKNFSILILILWIINASCETPTNVKFYYLKITPIVISDVPRVLIYISMIKLRNITNIDTIENVGIIRQIVTNEKTMKNIVSFINKYDSNKIASGKNFIEYGCLNISLYKKNTLITGYNLHRSDSQKYLNSLTDMLTKNGLDIRVIKTLKEDVLAPIDY